VNARSVHHNPLRVFQLFNAAIARAHAEGDESTVDLLLVAKMAVVRHYHGLPLMGWL
jgi:hypothetical protein